MNREDAAEQRERRRREQTDAEDQGYPLTPRYGMVEEEEDEESGGIRRHYESSDEPEEQRFSRLTDDEEDEENQGHPPLTRWGYVGDSTSSSEMDYEECNRENETVVSQPPGLTAPEIIGAKPRRNRLLPIRWVSQKVNEGKCKYTLRPGAKRIAPWVPQRIYQEWELQGQWPYVPPYEWDFADWENARGEPSPVTLKMCEYCDNRAHLTAQCPVETEFTNRYGKARGKTMARLRIVWG